MTGEEKSPKIPMTKKRKMEDSSISIKLVIDTKGNKVLYAEAGKDFVDFLFHILSLPLLTVFNLLSRKHEREDIVGSLGDLCKSAETLNSDYLQPNITKDTILKPEVSSSTAVKMPLLSSNDDHKSSEPTSRKFYGCAATGNIHLLLSCRKYVSDSTGAVCPNCSKMMCVEITYVAPMVSTKSDTSIRESKSGYVKGLVTYMVTDNLEVKPLSSTSVISVLNQFCVKDVSSLVEKDVHISFDEGIALLKASLQTKAVLTSVFL